VPPAVPVLLLFPLPVLLLEPADPLPLLPALLPLPVAVLLPVLLLEPVDPLSLLLVLLPLPVLVVSLLPLLFETTVSSPHPPQAVRAQAQAIAAVSMVIFRMVCCFLVGFCFN
jgi:hypothetical protein